MYKMYILKFEISRQNDQFFTFEEFWHKLPFLISNFPPKFTLSNLKFPAKMVNFPFEEFWQK